MSWKEFTPQELIELKKNPYVKSVTSKMVRFTVTFKEMFWEQYQNGKSPKAIVTDLGFDPEVLGESRINGILQHIKDAAGSSETIYLTSPPCKIAGVSRSGHYRPHRPRFAIYQRPFQDASKPERCDFEQQSEREPILH